MIILDTNVISEVMLPKPSGAVMAWLDEIPTFDLATTTISIAELRFGLARSPFGRRRRERERLFNIVLERSLGDRIFSFDRPAADIYGDLLADRERAGRPLRGPDGFIAAIAASRGFGIATRNVGDFADCGIALVNPWEVPAS